MAKGFSIEKKYQDYLKMVHLDESQMSEAQRIETKRAYYAAIGQLWIFITNDFIELSDDEADEAMEEIRTQTLNFWNKETENTGG